ncbi:MAG: hypothetical protein AB7F99_03730 [Vicinamibacterales bacterium]
MVPPGAQPTADSTDQGADPIHAQTSVFACAEGEFVFVGSRAVNDGPDYQTDPECYTGQEAAALLFGGSPSDCRISTVSDQVADINDRAWMDGWADSVTYGPDGVLNGAPHDFKVDVAPAGYAFPEETGGAYSAYVSDHSMTAVNYAFRCGFPA